MFHRQEHSLQNTAHRLGQGPPSPNNRKKGPISETSDQGHMEPTETLLIRSLFIYLEKNVYALVEFILPTSL